MYPPRSEKYNKRKKAKDRQQRRLWIWINSGLILVIVLLGAYLFFVDHPADSGTGNLEGRNQESTGAADSGNQGHTENPSEAENSGDAEPNLSGGESEGSSNQDTDPPEVVTEDPGTDEQDRVVISFAGDTLFSGKVETKLKQEGYDYPFRYVKDLFQQDDLTVLNLETPVTEGGTAAEDKTYVFKSSPQALPEMLQAGVDAVNLANNHILDQGVEGLLDTLGHLDEAGLLRVGAGKNSKEAYAPVYVERGGIRIALCGFTRVIPKSEWAAGKGPGVAATYDSRQAIKAVEAAREQADLVFVVAHWGKERTTELEKHQTELARAYIDAGADLVIGGHPHVLQGLESYKGKWIAYSTGNFIFTKSKDPKTWETAVFQAACSRDGDCNLKLTPYRTELGQPVPMNDEERTKLWSELEAISPGVGISESGEVRSKDEGSGG